MANQLFVKPTEGRRVLHEHTRKPLAAEGEYWPDTPYLRRRLRDVDVVRATATESLPVEARSAHKPKKG